jgi:hypothetical protein
MEPLKAVIIFIVSDAYDEATHTFPPLEFVDSHLALDGRLIEHRQHDRQFMLQVVPVANEQAQVKRIPEIRQESFGGHDALTAPVSIDGNKHYFLIVLPRGPATRDSLREFPELDLKFRWQGDLNGRRTGESAAVYQCEKSGRFFLLHSVPGTAK